MDFSHLFTHTPPFLSHCWREGAAALEGRLFVLLQVLYGALGTAQRRASIFVLCLSLSSRVFVRMFFTSCVVDNSLMNFLQII